MKCIKVAEFRQIEAGDFIVVRDDLEVGASYDPMRLTEEMSKYLGAEVKIGDISKNAVIDESFTFGFSRQMIAKVIKKEEKRELKIGDRIIVLDNGSLLGSKNSYMENYDYVNYVACFVNGVPWVHEFLNGVKYKDPDRPHMEVFKAEKWRYPNAEEEEIFNLQAQINELELKKINLMKDNENAKVPF